MDAITALRNVVAHREAAGPVDEGVARGAFIADRMSHYRQFNIPDAEVRRLAIADLRARF